VTPARGFFSQVAASIPEIRLLLPRARAARQRVKSALVGTASTGIGIPETRIREPQLGAQLHDAERLRSRHL